MADYDAFKPGPVEALATVHQLLLIDRGGGYQLYRVRDVRPFGPGGRAGDTAVMAVNLAPAAGIAAGGTVAQADITQIAVQTGELLHLRMAVLDKRVSMRLWFPQSVGWAQTARFAFARVTAQSRFLDPSAALTTFFVFGAQQDPFIEVFNDSQMATLFARVQFWGFKYTVDPAAQLPI